MKISIKFLSLLLFLSAYGLRDVLMNDGWIFKHLIICLRGFKASYTQPSHNPLGHQ